MYKMKKYFVSFRYSGDYNEGFANTTKTSLREDITMEIITSWEKEIASKPGIKRVDILFFKEIK